ncbi:Phosphate-specific outer membrane porin OprP Pyrophosphate-specific outer membrane porin OprO [Novosphingobium resinovorum]|uniref:Phosphate-specific outer membrane porin OprP Pyrophosphate-specific outer membrane porin OprO n=1 Tax=Novosphingobium resinovorum TaxID=158500 RepID=A0A031K1B5_9SPHN|nr:porin [Novosphingobium resinovorum]EZP83771.1 Phosphate-specific outer membrane porin OprP Pyrophosphate-specific outer membrane porin OprO [Novosphingobium resinovorum]
MTRTLMASAAFLALAVANPALAQAPTRDELADLVRAQAAEIASLRQRVDALEATRTTAAAPQQNAPVVAAAEPEQVAPTILSTQPYAAQLLPPGPAERDIERVRATAVAATDVTTEWGQGLPVFHSGDGTFSFKPRGRIITDVSTTRGSKYDGRNLTTTGMRALRMGLEGTVGSHLFYQFESDFSENAVDVVTAFIGWKNKIAPGLDYDVRVGHLFNDRSFEGSTGSDSTPFAERTVVATAIIPQRAFYGLGIMPRLFWKTGHASLTVTGDRIDGDQSTSDNRTVIARAHWNPIKSPRQVLHLGIWGFDEHLQPGKNTLGRSTVIGGRFNGALRLSTGDIIGGTGTTGYGAELGGYTGPLWVMAEAGERHARLDNGRPDFVTRAWSVSGGFFITGDLPPYNPRLGSFGQPKVLRPVFDGGPGAIELTARYENLEFKDIATPAQGWAATLGANWYLNSFVRFQVNAIHWNTENTAGIYTGKDDGETLTARVGVTF